MYVGIHLNNDSVAAATLDQNNRIILVKDESIEGEKSFINPLKIYIEDEFAYVGDKVDYLLTNNPDMEYAAHFSAALPSPTTPVYKDASGLRWNAAALLAVFLKKLKTDLQIYQDAPVKGAVVSVPWVLNTSLERALQLAFSMAGIPLRHVISLEKAAIRGYNVINPENTPKNVLVCHIDSRCFTLAITTLTGENDTENTYNASENNFGEQSLYDQLAEFLMKRYEQTTRKKVKENKKNSRLIKQLASELLTHFSSDATRQSLPLLCAIDDEIIELIASRNQLQNLVEPYLQQLCAFIETETNLSGRTPESIDTVLLTGNSAVIPLIEKHLKTLFHHPHQQLYHQSPEEALIKGAALCAGDVAQGLAEAYAPVETISLENPPGENTPAVNLAELNKLISLLHINAGCETL